MLSFLTIHEEIYFHVKIINQRLSVHMNALKDTYIIFVDLILALPTDRTALLREINQSLVNYPFRSNWLQYLFNELIAVKRMKIIGFYNIFSCVSDLYRVLKVGELENFARNARVRSTSSPSPVWRWPTSASPVAYSVSICSGISRTGVQVVWGMSTSRQR